MQKIKKAIAALTGLAVSVSMLTAMGPMSASAVESIIDARLPQNMNSDVSEIIEPEYPTLPDGYLEMLREQAAEAMGISPEQGEDGEFYYGDNYNTLDVVKLWITVRGQDFNEFDRRSNEIIAMIDPDWNNITKIAFLHDYIALNTKYDHTFKSTSAYDVLVNGQGICQSYSMAMWYLLEKLGIESRLVSSNQLNHEWNCIYLDGSWYMTDITWDDATWGDQSRLNYVRHEYLLKSNNSFKHNETNGTAVTDWHFADSQSVSAMNTAVDTRFDDYVWTNCDTALVYQDNCYFCVDKQGFFKADTSNNYEKIVDLSQCNWNWYGSGFSALAGYGNNVIFTTPGYIYAYNTLDKSINQIFKVSDEYFKTYGSIFDMTVKGNELIYRLTTTPNYDITGHESAYHDFSVSIQELLGEEIIEDNTEIEKFVDRLYTIILGRSAEPDGLATWTNNLASGKSTSAEIVYGIANSLEFNNKGLSNDEVIERMYQAMLGRGSDPSGKQTWLTAMSNGMTVTGIINGFSGSQEFANICAGYGIKAGAITSCEARDRNPGLTGFVSRMYTKALGRNYDVDGLNTWTGDYLSGKHDARGIAYGFIFSDEFKLKNLNDNDYVEVLYQTFFNRPSDPAGKAGWLNKLANGYTREFVLNGFLGSQEFAKLKAGFGV